MRYLLDTNIISDLMRNPAGRVVDRLRRVGDGNVCTSIVVACELRYGCAKKGSDTLSARVDAALSIIPVLAMNLPADAAYGAIRAKLEAAGRTIGHNDLLIAAHAASLGMVLVTGNTAEFDRVEGLSLENWLA
jgi:tRNA(fMet)-specific endonuclease VapC